MTVEYVDGRVSNILFEAKTGFYKVLLVSLHDKSFSWDDKEITVVGNFADILTGSDYHFEGNLITHNRYGQQFKAQTYQAKALSTSDGVIKYLASDYFPGIGTKTAEKIVSILGKDAINILLSDENQVDKLGLTEKQKGVLMQGLLENNGTSQVIVELEKMGFSNHMVETIIDCYQEKTLEVIRYNPYDLVGKVSGMSFKRLDHIANQIAADDPKRILGGLLAVLSKTCRDNGDTYMTADALLEQVLKLLKESRPTGAELSFDKISDVLIQAGQKGQVVIIEQRVYLKKLYDAEREIAAGLARLMQNDTLPHYEEQVLDEQLEEIEQELGISYGKDQAQAIKQALQTPVFLLTGGPGTGKTTIIRGICELYLRLNSIDSDDNLIKLAAPTGRAAQKLASATTLDASTIHHLLGITADTTDVNDLKEIYGRLLIVDESSMIDTQLMQFLVSCIDDGTQVIFCGDKNQLPSVGPGSIFSDMLASKVIPQVELKKIYRQGAGSTIVTLAKDIVEGQIPSDLAIKTSDRSFIACQDNQVSGTIANIVEKITAKKLAPAKNIQVLAPMYRGSAGIDQLNAALAPLLNPKRADAKKISIGEREFRIGDRVLQLKNDAEKGIYNGDIGYITSITEAKKESDAMVYVNFEGREVVLAPNDLYNLTLAYAMSIHKSQGSEFPLVIIPMVKQYQRMYARNLLYTAITRAKEKLILIGDLQAYADCIMTESLNRKTTLKDFLCEQFGVEVVPKKDGESKKTQVVKDGKTAFILTPQLVNYAQIDPMIGMEGLTPKDFM